MAIGWIQLFPSSFQRALVLGAQWDSYWSPYLFSGSWVDSWVWVFWASSKVGIWVSALWPVPPVLGSKPCILTVSFWISTNWLQSFFSHAHSSPLCALIFLCKVSKAVCYWHMPAIPTNTGKVEAGVLQVPGQPELHETLSQSKIKIDGCTLDVPPKSFSPFSFCIFL